MSKDLKNILVIRLSSLGDLILTFPVYASLKSAWPQARITVLTRPAFRELFTPHPQVDRVWVFEGSLWNMARRIRRERFDLLLDLHGTARSWVWSTFSGAGRVLRYNKRLWARRWLVWLRRHSPALQGGVSDWYLEPLERLGFSTPSRRPEFESTPEELNAARERLGPGSFIGVAPGARHATKRWPPERFGEAARRLSEAWGWRVMILGSSEDAAVALEVAQRAGPQVVNRAGKTTLRESAAELSLCSVLLSNDSGAMHLAAAVKVPVVALFGPTVREFGFVPATPRAEVVEVPGLKCRPCALHGLVRCPQGHFRCMIDISVDQVMAAAERLRQS